MYFDSKEAPLFIESHPKTTEVRDNTRRAAVAQVYVEIHWGISRVGFGCPTLRTLGLLPVTLICLLESIVLYCREGAKATERQMIQTVLHYSDINSWTRMWCCIY